MPEKVISVLVEGGKATTGPPIGPSLGPIGINAGKVVAEINEKTKQFAGITVPIKVIVDTVRKTYTVEIGTPGTAALIKKELLLEKGSGKAKEEKIGDITTDQLIKVARSKMPVLTASDQRRALKEIIGTCLTMGVLVDGKDPRAVQKEVDAGAFDDKLSGRTPLTEPSREELERKKAGFAKVIEEKHKAEEAAKAAAAPAEAAKEGEAKEGEAKEGAKTEEAKAEKRVGREEKAKAGKK